MTLGNEPDLMLFKIPGETSRKKRGAHVDAGGYRVMSVRMREPEYECFIEQVAAAGLTNNKALRIAARRIAGFLEIDDESRALLTDVSVAINTVSRALTALNQTATKTGTVDMAAFAQERATFGQQFVQLDEKLRHILNVSARRQDGMAMLKVAAANGSKP